MAGTPFFKFTVFNEGLYPDGVVINHPMGWYESLLKMERHKDFHSLVEFFESSFLWYGAGREIILAIEDDQGVDAKIRLLAQIRFNGVWDTIFDGQLDVSQIEDFAKANTFYKSKLPIIRDDFWSKLINRMKRTVDVAGTVDVDGAEITPLEPFTLPLPSQKIRQSYKKDDEVNYAGVFPESPTYSNTFDGTSGSSEDRDYYIQIGSGVAKVDEIEERFTYDPSISRTEPVENLFYQFKLKYGGVYALRNIKFHFKIRQQGFSGPSVVGDVRVGLFVVKKVNGVLSAPVRLSLYEEYPSQNLSAPAFANNWIGLIEYAPEYDLGTMYPGDEIYLYGKLELNNIDFSADGDVDMIFKVSTDYDADHQTSVELVGDTTYTDTDTDAFLIKDLFESVISKITGVEGVVQSTFYTTCAKLYALMKGLHVRGYSMAIKKFFMSLDDVWKIANPLQAIGMGYVEGENKIEIEHISDFYDPDPAINFSNVSDLTREYSLDNHYKSVKTGFTKWSAESDSGIDDPQTNGERFTRFQNFGSDISIMTEGYMASLGIERSRRNRVELGKDDRLDEETMVIRLTEESDGYRPELGSQFNTTNLLNPDERYNVRDTPAVIFKRWQAFLQGCLQKYLGDFFKFDGGEGNYVMTKEFPEYDCEFPNLEIAEDQNIEVTEDYLFIPKIYKCSVPMDYSQYKTIRENRKKAIGISKTSSGHVPMFIMELNWRIMASRAEFVLMLGDNVKI